MYRFFGAPACLIAVPNFPPPTPAPGVLRAYGQAPRMAEQQESDPGLLEKFESVPEYANYLLTCGKRLYHQEQYEGALQAFMHSVSVMEQPGQTFDADELEWRGAMLHNMASCLHHLAELDAARAYYELAIASFRHAEVHGARPCAQTAIRTALTLAPALGSGCCTGSPHRA